MTTRAYSDLLAGLDEPTADSPVDRTRAAAAAIADQSRLLGWVIPLSFVLSWGLATATVAVTLERPVPPTVFVFVFVVGPLAWGTGYFVARLSSALMLGGAGLLLCQADTLDAITHASRQLTVAHTETAALLRFLGQQMVDGDMRRAELLRIVAKNTDTLSRPE